MTKSTGIKVATAAWSFPQGINRTVEEMLFHGFYSLQVGTPMPIRKGVTAQFNDMVLYGELPNVIASALTIRGIEQTVRQLPFGIKTPVNLLRGEDLDKEIDSVSGFFATLLRQFGVNPIGELKKNVGWIIVDPDQMGQEITNLSRLAKEKTLTILQPGVEIPKEMRSWLNGGLSAEVADFHPTSALAPFADPALEQALLQMNVDHYVVVGAGDRLLPTIIGVADTILQNVSGIEHIDNATRQQICRKFVSYMPVNKVTFQTPCVFPEAWFSGTGTLRSKIAEYLINFGFATDALQPDNLNTLDHQGDYKIVPYWQ